MQQHPPHRSTHHPHRRTEMKPTMAAALALSALATGAAGAQDPHPAPAVPDPARDHASILAMQGEQIVDFALADTVLLPPGYELSTPVPRGGHEALYVVEDQPPPLRRHSTPWARKGD